MSEEVELKIDTPNNLSRSELSDTEKEFRRKIYWKSCCFDLDRRAVKFFSQLSISLIVIIFSLYQLHKEKNTEIYLSLLTMILGVYVEAPRLH
jgi:hypothetical protein